MDGHEVPDGQDELKVRLLAVPQVTPTSVMAFLEVFGAVGRAWQQLTGEPTGARRFDTRIIARNRTPFRSATGPMIEPHLDMRGKGEADVVIVTDLDIQPGLDMIECWSVETAWLRKQYEAGAMICSICTGSALLAASGLLDGLEATSHWAASELFRTHFPAVRLRAERTLCPAGPEHRIVTGGGQGAWEDLALYLIARFAGPAEAARIAKIYLLGDRSAGQLPFSAMPRPRNHEDGVIADCQIWLADNYRYSHPVSRMIDMSGLTERTFKRRFKTATGYSPIGYVQALRIEEAKQALETGHATIEEIALEVGYKDPAYFRKLFKRATGVSPAEYRRRFSRDAFLEPF